MSEDDLTGGCQCGAIRYRLVGQPSRVNHCHCVQCRKQTGSAMATWVMLPRDKIIIEKGEISYWQSSVFAERGFCPTCGSALVWRRTDNLSNMDVAAGSLDHPERVQPLDHYWNKDRLPWMKIEDGLPCYETAPGSLA